LEFALKVKL